MLFRRKIASQERIIIQVVAAARTSEGKSHMNIAMAMVKCCWKGKSYRDTYPARKEKARSQDVNTFETGIKFASLLPEKF